MVKFGENNGKPYEQMDDLGVPLFLETPIQSWKNYTKLCTCKAGLYCFLMDNFTRLEIVLKKISWRDMWNIHIQGLGYFACQHNIGHPSVQDQLAATS